MNCKIRKICFAASSGGHYEQLMMLRPLMDKYDSFIVTEEMEYEASADAKGRRVYYINKTNRKETFVLWKMLLNSFKSFYIFIKERPDAIICTGVLATVPLCLICKLFKRKLIYIESFAKVTSPTETGKFLYTFADQFYVQWEQMLNIYPKGIYLGGIY